jgi:C-terminal peptidase prc
MTAWATLRRVGTAAVAFLVASFAPPASGQEPVGPPRPKPSPADIRAAAAVAEQAGDWETAFTAYCHLFVADRTAPDVREKLNSTLRRAQQLRRHRDPLFQQFAVSTSVSDSLTLFGEVLTKVPVMYADPDRTTPQALWQNGIEELSRAFENPAFRQAFLEVGAGEKVDAFRRTLRYWAKQPIPDARAARVQLRKLLTSAQDQLVIRLPQVLALEVVCGACSGLDEYTVFLSPAHATTDSGPGFPNLTAQGVYLGFADNTLVVAGVVPGSWAAHHTPLRRGDRIAAVNGRPMDRATPDRVADALREHADGYQELELTPADPGSTPAIVRLPSAVPTIYGATVMNSREGIGYVRVGNFGPTTPRELDDAINSLKFRGVRVLILDLRGNTGGSFLAAIETTKRLLPAGLIVTTRGQLAEVANVPFSSDSGMTAHDLPAVLLIDAETASAAEILAAALKDHNRATLVGMPTFGKGAIQYPLRLDSLDDKDDDGNPRTNRSGTVRLTIARLIGPRGGVINGVGVEPHFAEPDPARQLELALEKAVELLASVSPSRPPPSHTVIP